MALSDYERRVLDEIEAELRLRPVRRWQARRAFALVGAGILVAGGLLALAALFLPAGLDVAAGAVVGIALGYFVAMTWRQRQSHGDGGRAGGSRRTG